MDWHGQTVRWSRRGTGPAVVFCHGTPWSSTLWEPIAEALAEDFTVHLWDMLGYGTSTMVEEQDVSLAVQGQVLADLFRLVADNASVFARLPPPLHEALVRAYIAGAARRPLSAATHDMLTTPWLGDRGRPAFYRQIAAADQRHTDEVEPLYPTRDIPVLVVWGVEDTWIPVDRAHRLAEVIPGAELRLVEGAGHLIQLDAPEALTAVLQRWLHGVERA